MSLLAEASMSRHVVPPLFHSLSVGSSGSGTGLGLGSTPSTPLSVALSPRSLALYSSEDTVESVIGQFSCHSSVFSVFFFSTSSCGLPVQCRAIAISNNTDEKNGCCSPQMAKNYIRSLLERLGNE